MKTIYGHEQYVIYDGINGCDDVDVGERSNNKCEANLIEHRRSTLNKNKIKIFVRSSQYYTIPFPRARRVTARYFPKCSITRRPLLIGRKKVDAVERTIICCDMLCISPIRFVDRRDIGN